MIALTIGLFALGMGSIAYAQDAPPATVETSTTISTPTPNTPPQKVVECQAGSWIGDPSGNLKCAGASLIISILAGLNSLFTTILQWATSAFSFAIEKTIVNFKVWFDSVNAPIAQAWTLFRDLANIAIIGIFVFIAISIILGLQEYGQKKLIARVIIIATLINFSFLFTVIIINSSNLFASTIYKSMPVEVDKTTGQPLGIGEQFVRYMGVYSYRDTSNLLMQKYNDPTQGFGAMFAYGAFSALFALSAAAVFLYGALLLFARAVILAIVLLPISSLAFATYLAPSFEETGWKRWWHSLLQQSFLAPLLMLFVLISLNIAKTVGENAKIAAEQAAASGQASALANFASNPASAAAWNSAFTFIVILGSLLAGIYIASQLAGGAARRFATVGSGSMVGLGAAVGAFGGRNIIGRAYAQRAHAKEDAAKNTLKEIHAGRLAGRDVSGLEAKYQKLLRQGSFAGAQAKRTFDLRNTPAGSLLQKTGLPKSVADGTKKNYADIAHAEAEKAAKTAAKTSLSKEDMATIAKKEVEKTHGNVEGEHAAATQGVQEARTAMRRVREEGEKVAEEHEKTAREARERQQNLEREHSSTSDAAVKARLQTQIVAEGENIARAKRSAESARNTAANTAARMMPDLKVAENKQKETRAKLSDFNTAVNAVKKDVEKNNIEQVEKTARELVGNRFQQALYKATGVGDKFILHEASVAATSRAKIKDKAEEKKKIDAYLKPDHAAHGPSGDAHSGDAH